MHQALPPPLPPMGWVPYTAPIWDLPPPPWCGGGEVAFPFKGPWNLIYKHLRQAEVRFNRVWEKVPEKVPGSLSAKPSQVQRVPEKVPEKEPGQVQQGFEEGSGEGLGRCGAEPGQVQQGSEEGSGEGSWRLWRRARSGWTDPEKVWEALVQSQVRLNRVPEKVPEKVPGSLGAKPSHVHWFRRRLQKPNQVRFI